MNVPVWKVSFLRRGSHRVESLILYNGTRAEAAERLGLNTEAFVWYEVSLVDII